MRPLKDLFIEEYWTVAVRKRNGGGLLSDFSGGECFKIYKTLAAFWIADPFLYEFCGDSYLFYELFDNKKEKGVIAVSEIADTALTPPRKVLETKYHLSYPMIFSFKDKCYMLPETYAAGCLEMYKPLDFPDKWTYFSSPLDDICAVDSTIFEHNEKLYMFTAVPMAGNNKKTELLLYVYDENGSWQEHPQSPVGQGECVRPAGRIFSHNGDIFRPSQMSEGENYGTGIIFNRIDKLTETEYKESEYKRILPENIKLENDIKPIGVHTYALNDEYEVVDIKLSRINIKRIIYIIISKFKRIITAN